MEHPEFCNDCSKVGECKQKHYMLASTQPIQGYVNFNIADYTCFYCLDENAPASPLDESEKLDGPAHCTFCGIPLKCQLTQDGVEYVKEGMENGGGCCRELWPVLFADYLNLD